MKSRKISDDLINRNLQLDDGDGEESIYHMEEIDLRKNYPDHCVTSNWFYPLCSRREFFLNEHEVVETSYLAHYHKNTWDKSEWNTHVTSKILT